MKKYTRIAQIRNEKGLSQERTAKMIDTSLTQYQRYENSNGNSFFEAMIKIASLYNVSLDYIAGLTDDRGGLHPNSEDEHNIMNGYTKLSERNKGKVEQLIADLLESQNKGEVCHSDTLEK